jgi:branched-chain amino acid transport system ATP-binding protein
MSEPILTLRGLHRHRPVPHPARRRSGRAARAGDDAAGPQRRGQDHDAAHDHGPLAAARRQIAFDGAEIAGLAPPAIARRGIGFVPEDMGIFADLTVEENLILAAVSGPIRRDRLDWVFAAFPALATFWKMPAGNLSGGQKQMLAIARAVIERRGST